MILSNGTVADLSSFCCSTALTSTRQILQAAKCGGISALTVRDKSAIPSRCKLGDAWCGCYNRQHHQVTLWNRGTLWNSWLVRGGSSSHPNRLGHYEVYYRDKDHVSSIYDLPMP